MQTQLRLPLLSIVKGVNIALPIIILLFGFSSKGLVLPNEVSAISGSTTVTVTATSNTNGACTDDEMFTITVNTPVIVEAGMPQTICSTGALMLSSLSADISGGTTTGTWTSNGTGTFDIIGNGNFALATTYTPSAADIAVGTVTLTLTSTGAISPCIDESDTVVITITNVSCDSSFPWSGND